MDTPDELLPRAAREVIADRLRRMPVVVVTGPRQVGKTTLARHLGVTPPRRYWTLDDLTTLDRARRSPADLVGAEQPVTIDEVQRAPELLLAVKREVDAHRENGRFLLTGSANLLLLDRVADSLSGRAVYVVLRPLTEREKRGDGGRAPWSDLCEALSLEGALGSLPAGAALDWEESALRGGFPPAAGSSDPADRTVWFEGYVETYVQRDLRDLAQVGDLAAFRRLMQLCFHRSGGLSNASDLAREAELPRTTVLRWLSILETSFLLTVLPAFGRSGKRRLVGAPKLYAGDTGLGLHLAGLRDAESVASGPRAGAWLESLVLNDLLAWRETLIPKPAVFHWRDAHGAEIDFVVEHGSRFLPIEVKASSSLRQADARAAEEFCVEHGERAPFGIVLYDGEEAYPLARHVAAIPLRRVI